jgi:hypothetical protein
VGIPYQQWREWTKDRPDASEVLALHPDAPTRPSRFKGEGKGCWRITVPGWHPARLNELLPNRWQAHKLKKRDRSAIAFWSVMCNGPFVPEATGPRRVHLSITLGKGQRAADPDAYWKSLLDALVACKLLVDDNRQNVVLDPVEFSRGKEPETTVELYDL